MRVHWDVAESRACRVVATETEIVPADRLYPPLSGYERLEMRHEDFDGERYKVD